jgi:endonuclease/exonuclease/phosphatase family metal-dependent hydrolase
VRVLTLNVFSHYRDWRARCRVLAAGLRDLNPDVVALQETITRSGYDQVRELLGPSYEVVHQRGRDQDGGGASIASKWPLEGI